MSQFTSCTLACKIGQIWLTSGRFFRNRHKSHISVNFSSWSLEVFEYDDCSNFLQTVNNFDMTNLCWKNWKLQLVHIYVQLFILNYNWFLKVERGRSSYSSDRLGFSVKEQPINAYSQVKTEIPSTFSYRNELHWPHHWKNTFCTTIADSDLSLSGSIPLGSAITPVSHIITESAV